jgi:hypothetical protein
MRNMKRTVQIQKMRIMKQFPLQDTTRTKMILMNQVMKMNMMIMMKMMTMTMTKALIASNMELGFAM